MTHLTSGGNSLFPVGGQSLLNFRQNFQISDIPPPPFAFEKTVFSPLLDQNFRKFVNFPEGGGGGGRPTKISATAFNSGYLVVKYLNLYQ
jgi:hypothetical protein